MTPSTGAAGTLSGRRGGPPRRLAAALAVAAALGGCATQQHSGMGPGDKLDPWESWNRKVFSFNEGLDEYVLKPVATGYAKVLPQPVRQAIGNFFGNFADAWSAVNNALQGKGEAATRDVARVTINTLFGVFGFFDPASEAGLDHQYEDFGQTLGRWGVGAGAYLVWPVIGPSTVRETVALPLDRAVSPALLVDGGASVVSIYALQLVNTRAGLLNASRVLDDIALDKYTFVRDAYLQRRRSLVFDGDEPAPADTPDAAASPLPPPAAATAPQPAASSPTPPAP